MIMSRSASRTSQSRPAPPHREDWPLSRPSPSDLLAFVMHARLTEKGFKCPQGGLVGIKARMRLHSLEGTAAIAVTLQWGAHAEYAGQLVSRHA